MADKPRCERVLLADIILTLDPEHPIAQAIMIDHGTIVAVGTREEGLEWARHAGVVTDLGAATVTPGLADSHSHPVSGMRTVRGIDLGSVTDVDDLARTLRAHADDTADWIQGWNLGPAAYANSSIDVDFFDSVLPGRPVLLKTFDYHAAFVSREALDRAGVHSAVAFSSNAEIECDENGVPTGVVWEMEAVAHVEKAIPQPPLTEQARELHSLLREMAATGLTLTHSLILDDAEIALLEEAERQGPLPLRYLASPVCEPGSTLHDLARIAELQTRRGERWKIEGVKFFLDGTIDNGTAWLRSPDSHGESTESIWQDPEEYAAAVGYFAERGIPIATHAIGDAAVEFAVRTLGSVPRPGDGTHRIEHIEVLPAHLVPLFVELDVTASMQPAHSCISVRADHSDNWSQRLGSDRVARGFAQKDIIAAGGRLIIGSDWPIGPFDAREILAIAELRRPVHRHDLAPVLPDQRLSREEAITAFTRAPAEAAGRLGEGTISTGKRATLTAYAGDLLATAPDDLPGLQVVLTLIDGQPAYTPSAWTTPAAV